MAIYGRKCCITGCNVIEVLQAAHVTAHNGKPSNVPENGMLLRADIQNLWDRFLIAIDPETKKLEISNHLKGTEYEKYEGKKIFENIDIKKVPTKDLLQRQHNIFKEKK